MTDIDLTGIGAHTPCPKRGLLVFASLPDPVQRAEDATQFADFEARSWRANVTRYRPATETERALLRYLDINTPVDLITAVRWLTDGVRRRTWPQLANQITGDFQ